MTKNIFYCDYIGPCGGIETFEYYLAKHFKNDPDICIELWYKRGDTAQIELFKTVADVVKWDGSTKIICDNFFFPSRNCGEALLSKVVAKNIVECFHMAEVFNWNTVTSPKVTKCLAVSNAAAEEWTKKTGVSCETFYPIIEIDKPECDVKLSAVDNKLHLISCSRLDTEDKGSGLMKKLADRMDDLNIEYEWTIYGLMDSKLNNKGFNYKGKTLDKNLMFGDVVKNDFFVQLSRAEGFGMSIAEALHLNIPLVSTPIKVLPEHNTSDENCIILNFDGSNIDDVIKKMINNKYNFNYIGPASNWKSILL